MSHVHNTSSDKKSMISRRQTAPEEEENLSMTPQLEADVAENLAQFIDSQLELVEERTESPEQTLTAEADSGFRLFRTSDPTTTTTSNAVRKKKRPVSSSSDSGLDDEKFASVAVTSDDIVAQSRLQYPSQAPKCFSDPWKEEESSSPAVPRPVNGIEAPRTPSNRKDAEETESHAINKVKKKKSTKKKSTISDS